MESFQEEALRYGFGMHALAWRSVPQPFANIAMGAVKSYARYLKKERLSQSHSQALESVSRAAGLQHWHELNSILTSLAHWSDAPTAAEEDADHPGLSRVVGVLPFMVGAPPEVRPSTLAINAFQDVATRLSGQLNCKPEQVLKLIAQMHSCESWEALLNRDPVDASRPLYEFVVDASGKEGFFNESRACAELVFEQDEIFQGYSERTAAEQKQFRAWIKQTLKKQPGFLEGWLAQGTVYEHFGKDQELLLAGPCYDEAIAQADALIPADFKGSIPWHELGNRFFHRLLYAAMVHKVYTGDLASAIKLARRQLDTNPSDNLGVRIWYVVLLAKHGQLRSIGPALRGLGDIAETDAQIDLARSIGCFVIGDVDGARGAIIRALLRWPPARWVVMRQQDALISSLRDRASSRGVIPDAQTTWQQFHYFADENPGFRTLAQTVVQDHRVRKLEEDMAARFHATAQARDNGQSMAAATKAWETWCELSLSQAVAVANELSQG